MRTVKEVERDINTTKNRITAMNTDLIVLEEELKKIKDRRLIGLGDVVKFDGRTYLEYIDGSWKPHYGYQLVLIKGSCDLLSTGLHNSHTIQRFMTLMDLNDYVYDMNAQYLGKFSDVFKEKC